MEMEQLGFEEDVGGLKRERTVRVARRVYVGNLSWGTSWQTLKDRFSEVGNVRYADVLREAGPGSRSKGCGIVEFETPEEALAAIQQLNHTDLDGRQIFDREDYELRQAEGALSGSEASYRQGPPKRVNRSGGGGGGGSVTIGRRVYVGNLPFELTWQDLKDHFRSAGNLRVTHADILTDPSGQSKGCGIVEFESPSDALKSISLLSNSLLGGRQISVREDREDPALAGGGRSGRSSAGGSAPPMGSAVPGTQVVVLGLPYRTQWQGERPGAESGAADGLGALLRNGDRDQEGAGACADLKDLFRQAGNVLRTDVMTNPDGSSKGWGLVQFSSPVDAQTAINMFNGSEYEGRVLTVKLDKFSQG
eukprot:scaffold3.g6612.t1